MPREPILFDNSYARLPEAFYARLPPKPVARPQLIRVNGALAELLGIDPDFLASPEGVGILSGNKVPEGATPLAMAYAGHQFGHFVPQLGDGRANLLGEVVGCDGVRRDIQLKGAGPTPFSRMGDGRAALGPVLREYIVSEAMHTLHVPTTRALAAIATGERVVRETVLPGAILARVAKSHIRIGTFQFFAVRGEWAALRLLADHARLRHYPETAGADEPYLAFLDGVIGGQARLIAKWISLGFIHGVMNTDNMSVAGETIDYGPCAFMDSYDPGAVFSSVDEMGRYAFANQPPIGHWNLMQFARCLLPLLDGEPEKATRKAQASLDAYPDLFEAALADEMRLKLALRTKGAGDLALARDLLDIMAEKAADFTLAFRGLADLVKRDGGAHPLFADSPEFGAWAERWRTRLFREGQNEDSIAAVLCRANPAVIPRNHLVEEAIRAAEDEGDFSVFEKLVETLNSPFDEQPEGSRYKDPPRPEQRILKTFCGT